MQDNSELMLIFKEEADELITTMRNDLFSLQEEIADAAQNGLVESPKADNEMPLIKDLFRCTHTLKGSSQAVGFDRLAEMSTSLMRIFQAVKEGRIYIKPESIPLLYNGVEACSQLFKKENPMNYEELLEQIKAIAA